MFSHARFLVHFIDVFRSQHALSPIAFVHGCPLAFLWNGGRVNYDRVPEKKDIDWTLDNFQRLNIPCFLTFSNRFITPEDLDDPDCNYLLAKLADQNHPENGVLVTGDVLSDYIREKYPQLKQMASIIKVTCENGAGNPAYYRQLEERFDKYVVAVDDNWNDNLLSQLDKTKAEILVNSRCVIGCPHKADHYDRMAGLHKHHSKEDVDALMAYQEANCKAYPIPRQIGNERNYTLSHEELRKLYTMGFRYFKIQGRYTASQYSILHDMAHFMFEPRFKADIVFHAFG